MPGTGDKDEVSTYYITVSNMNFRGYTIQSIALCDLTYSQVLGIRMRTSLAEPLFCLPQGCTLNCRPTVAIGSWGQMREQG